MIKNTIENKKRFMAIYVGQDVYQRNWYQGGKNFKMHSFYRDDVEETYVLLKSLSSSSISDQEAIEIAKIMTIQDTTGDDVTPFVKLCIKTYIDKGYKGYNGIDLNIADFLRSRGYLLPWMGLTPDEIINYGWAKLTGGKP